MTSTRTWTRAAGLKVRVVTLTLLQHTVCHDIMMMSSSPTHLIYILCSSSRAACESRRACQQFSTPSFASRTRWFWTCCGWSSSESRTWWGRASASSTTRSTLPNTRNDWSDWWKNWRKWRTSSTTRATSTHIMTLATNITSWNLWFK